MFSIVAAVAAVDGGRGGHGTGASGIDEVAWKGAKRIIVSSPTSELACTREYPGGPLRCLRGGPVIQLKNGSTYSEGTRPRGQLVKQSDSWRPRGMGKVVTPDPPFSVIRFMSVLPTTSNARRERQHGHFDAIIQRGQRNAWIPARGGSLCTLQTAVDEQREQ